MSPYRRRPAPAPVREPHVRPRLHHMTTNLLQLRLPARTSSGRSRISPGPLRAAQAGALPRRLSALGQRPLGAPTATPREPAGGSPRRGPFSGPRGECWCLPDAGSAARAGLRAYRRGHDPPAEGGYPRRPGPVHGVAASPNPRALALPLPQDLAASSVPEESSTSSRERFGANLTTAPLP